jgi:hypothetical protein
MAKTPKQQDATKNEQHPDAWRRFERAVDAAVKGGPKHRPSKSPAAKQAVQKKPKR